MDLISAEELRYIQDSWTTSSYRSVEPTCPVYGEKYLDMKRKSNFPNCERENFISFKLRELLFISLFLGKLLFKFEFFIYF